jgi:predicted permease
VIPGIIFVKLYETIFDLTVFMTVIFYCVIFIGILFILSMIIARLFHWHRSIRIAFSNSIIFYNAGNYGIPVNDLVFKSDPFTLAIQVIIVTIQDILTFSYGAIALQSLNGNKLKALLNYFKMPIFYAITLGILFNVYQVKLPSFILVSTQYIADALIAIAVLTLGAQVAFIKLNKNLTSVYISVGFRLLLAPVIGYLLIILFQLEGIVAQTLFISTAMPTSVNSVIIAQEYKNEPEYAAQTVLISTVFSALTVSIVIYLAFVLF